MAKSTGANGRSTGTALSTEPDDRPDADGDEPSKLKEKEYQHQLRVHHGELVAIQEWVKATGAKVCVVFEGRDAAGKGGTIKAMTERVSPRVFRVVALAAPTPNSSGSWRPPREWRRPWWTRGILLIKVLVGGFSR